MRDEKCIVKKSIKKNYFYNLGYQILLLLTPLITTPYISRVLGADGVGTVSYAISVVSYFELFARMGIATYGQREISYVQDSLEKRSAVFWNTKVLGWCISGIALAAYLLFILFRQQRLLYLVLALNILAVSADVTWFFQGMEEFGIIVLRNMVFKILNVGYVFLAVRTKEDVVMYAMGLAAFLFLSNISLWCYIPRYVKPINAVELHPFRGFKAVWSLFVPTIAIQIYTVLDKTMIGVITDSSFENGYYEQAIKLSKVLLVVVTALGTVMIPRIGYYFEKKETDEVRRLMYRGYRFVWFLGIPLCFGLVMVAPNLVPWFFGEGFEKVVYLLQILSFLILAIGINNVTGMQYLIPTRRQHLFTVTVVIGAAVNFLLNMCLIRVWQSTGAAIASVAAETVIAVVQLILVRKELNPMTVLKEGKHYFVAGACMVLVLFFTQKLLTPSLIHSAILTAVGAVSYFSALLVVRDEFFKGLINGVFKRLKK